MSAKKQFDKPVVHPDEFSQWNYKYDWTDDGIQKYSGNKYQLFLFTRVKKYSLFYSNGQQVFSRTYEELQDIKNKLKQFNYIND